MTPTHLVVTLAAALVAIVATARVTRLLIHDLFPPTARLREWYLDHASPEWGVLLECPFCLAPWLGLINLGWAVWVRPDLDATGWSGVWWFLNVWMAGVYLAACFVARDEPAA